MIATLKMAPQSIPESRVLMVLMIVGHVGAGVMLAATSIAIDAAAMSALLGSAVMIAFVYLILLMKGMRERLVQTITALAGCEILVGLIALPMTHAFHIEGGESGLIAILSLLIFAWNIMIAAHIFRHAFNITSQQGVFYAVFYIFTSLIVGTILGVTA